MIVKDIMSVNLVTVSSDTIILDVMKLMREFDLGFIVVVENKVPIGVITDRDIILALSLSSTMDDEICRIMKKNIITIDQYSHINDSSDLLGNMQIRRLVVTNEKKEICGVMSIADLARHILLEDNALEAITEVSYDFKTKQDQLIHIETHML